MAKTISKTLTVTRAAYKTVEVQDGEPKFVDHPDAIFSGLLEKDKVERLLKAQLGKDAMIVVTSVEAGQHRYVMDLEIFVLNARIADGEPEDAGDADAPETGPAPADPSGAPASAPDTAPAPQGESGTGGQAEVDDDDAAPF